MAFIMRSEDSIQIVNSIFIREIISLFLSIRVSLLASPIIVLYSTSTRAILKIFGKYSYLIYQIFFIPIIL